MAAGSAISHAEARLTVGRPGEAARQARTERSDERSELPSIQLRFDSAVRLDYVAEFRGPYGWFAYLWSESPVRYARFLVVSTACQATWTAAPDNPSAASAVSAMFRAIGAGSAFGARGRTSCKRVADANWVLALLRLVPQNVYSPWAADPAVSCAR
jgi:hypothetical protein